MSEKIEIHLFNYIDNFYCLRDKNYHFKVLSKEHKKFLKNTCKIYKYKSLCACNLHENDENKLDAVIKLIASTQNNNISTIHFRSKISLNYAKKYFHNFGIFSHYCCNGKGVMFQENFDNAAGPSKCNCGRCLF